MPDGPVCCARPATALSTTGSPSGADEAIDRARVVEDEGSTVRADGLAAQQGDERVAALGVVCDGERAR